jgi:uncharacterized Zn finger protein
VNDAPCPRCGSPTVYETVCDTTGVTAPDGGRETYTADVVRCLKCGWVREVDEEEEARLDEQHP